MPNGMGGTVGLSPTPGATVTVELDASVPYTIAEWTAGENETVELDIVAPLGATEPANGQRLMLVIVNDGTSPRTITFGSGFTDIPAIVGVVSQRAVVFCQAVGGAFVGVVRQIGGVPAAHNAAHENGGFDELNVGGLSGVLTDPQPPIIGGGATQAAAGDHTHAGGGVSQMIVPLVSDAAGIIWTNMPAAVTFFGGSHRFAVKLNLTDYAQVRLIVNKQGTAGAAASIVRLRYRTAFDTTVGNWLQIGSSSVQVAVNVQNTVLDSGWIDLAAGAKADVFVTLDSSGGDGTLDPAFGSLVAQFR